MINITNFDIIQMKFLLMTVIVERIFSIVIHFDLKNDKVSLKLMTKYYEKTYN